MAPALFVEPASPVPMTTQVGVVVGDDYEVSLARFDEPLTSRTHIPLPGCVGLDGYGHLRIRRAAGRCGHRPARVAQSTSPAASASVMATMATSPGRGRLLRNGLKPIQAS